MFLGTYKPRSDKIMKMSIKWHEDCLVNMKRGLQEKKECLLRSVRELESFEAQTSFSELQLLEAKRRNLDGYDYGRFMKKKRG